ncbi:MAG: hypothetical protein V3W31_10025 [Thermodesulfobacteriota bacterium]
MPTPFKTVENGKIGWTEYKTVKQYQTMGDLLDEIRAYGSNGAKLIIEEGERAPAMRNGHRWLTKDP